MGNRPWLWIDPDPMVLKDLESQGHIQVWDLSQVWDLFQVWDLLQWGVADPEDPVVWESFCWPGIIPAVLG